MTKIFGIAGFSGSGKTTLMLKLIPVLAGLGLKITSIKHTHHKARMDREGDLGFAERKAGAIESIVGNSKAFLRIEDYKEPHEASLPEIIRRVGDADLVLIEGFKHYPHPKLEIHRPIVGKPTLFPEDRHILAVASDEKFENLPIPFFDLDDIEAIAAFVLANALAIEDISMNS